MLVVEAESSRLPEVGEVPYQSERHIFLKCRFSKSKVVSCAFQGLISGSGYTTSQQMTACLNEFVSGIEHRFSLFGTF